MRPSIVRVQGNQKPAAVGTIAKTGTIGDSIEYLCPKLLQPDPSNPRIHPPGQIKKLQRSIERYGFLVPILVVGKERRIVAGHGCLQAALASGLSQVPVLRLEGLTEAKARAFGLAHNRLAEDSSWDDGLLAKVLRTLEQDGTLDIEDTGFSIPEIDIRFESLRAAGEEPTEAPLPLPGSKAISKPGDVFKLGNHRLGCLDALKEESYRALLAGKRAQLVLTDPPYNLRAREIGGRGAIKHRNFVMAAGEMSQSQFTDFLSAVFRCLVHHSSDGSLHYFFMDWRHAYELLGASRAAYAELKAVCVWVKSNGGQGALYRSQHELVFVLKKGRGTHQNNVQLGRHGRNRTNVWHYTGMNDFSRKGDEGNLLALHPSVKPVKMLADAMLDASTRGALVLDPFIGSGSTLVAAERVGRYCFGMELDPLYLDVAIRRWQSYTGEKAIHAESGKEFDRLAARRQ